MSTQVDLTKHPEVLSRLDHTPIPDTLCPVCDAKLVKTSKTHGILRDGKAGFDTLYSFNCGCNINVDERTNILRVISQCPHATVLALYRPRSAKIKVEINSVTALAKLTVDGRVARFSDRDGGRWSIDYNRDTHMFWLIDEATEQNNYYNRLPDWLNEEIASGITVTVNRK